MHGRNPVDVALAGGGDFGRIHVQAGVPLAVRDLVGRDVDPGVVEDLRQAIPVDGGRTVSIERDVGALVELAGDGGRVVELLARVDGGAAGLRLHVVAQDGGRLILDAEHMAGELLAQIVVQACLPVHVAQVRGADIRAPHVERLARISLRVGDVDALVVEQLVDVHVRAAADRVVRGECDVAAARHGAGDVRRVEEPLVAHDGRLAHIAGQGGRGRADFDEAALPRVVVVGLERFRTVGTGEVVDEHVVAGLVVGRGLDVHARGDGLLIPGVVLPERDAAAADLVRAVARGDLPFAEQPVVGVGGRLRLGSRLELLVLRAVAGAGARPPDADLGFHVGAEPIGLVRVELAVVLGQAADGDRVHDVLVQARVLFEHGGVMVRSGLVDVGFGDLSERVDIVGGDVVWLRLLVLENHPHPGADAPVLRVDVVGAVRVLRGDGPLLAVPVERGVRGGDRVAVCLGDTVQIVGGLLVLVLLEDREVVGLPGIERVVVAFGGHVGPVDPFIALLDAAGHLVADPRAPGDDLVADLGGHGRLEVAPHLERDVICLSPGIGRSHQVLVRGFQFGGLRDFAAKFISHLAVAGRGPCNMLIGAGGGAANRVRLGLVKHGRAVQGRRVLGSRDVGSVPVLDADVDGAFAFALRVLVFHLQAGGRVGDRLIPQAVYLRLVRGPAGPVGPTERADTIQVFVAHRIELLVDQTRDRGLREVIPVPVVLVGQPCEPLRVRFGLRVGPLAPRTRRARVEHVSLDAVHVLPVDLVDHAERLRHALVLVSVAERDRTQVRPQARVAVLNGALKRITHVGRVRRARDEHARRQGGGGRDARGDRADHMPDCGTAGGIVVSPHIVSSDRKRVICRQ